MTKQEKIKKEWANYYSEKVNDNGWLDIHPQQFANEEYFDRLKFNSERHSIRPKSLQGIENNNGWIFVEDEKQIPRCDEYDMSSFELYFFTNNGIYKANDLKKWISTDKNLKISITHYRLEPIFKPGPPIY